MVVYKLYSILTKVLHSNCVPYMLPYLEKVGILATGRFLYGAKNDAKRQKRRKIVKTNPKSKEKLDWTASEIHWLPLLLKLYTWK